MKKENYIPVSPKRDLCDIAFYKDVLELFKLSRKLKTSPIPLDHTKTSFRETEDIFSRFTQYLLQLPLSIAEAEVTQDYVKKIHLQCALSNTLENVFFFGSKLKDQLDIKGNQRPIFESKIKKIKTSYRQWVSNFPSAN